MKKTLLTIAAAFCYSLVAFAQTPPHRTCGTMDYHEYLKQTRKGYEADFNQYNQMLEQYMNSSQFAAKTNGTAATITIPVVIHVVYNTAVQNISDAQATSQFSVLDNDFNHLNADTVNIPVPFRAVAGKTGINFCLAVRDPNGNATTGIVHKSTTTTSFTTDNKIKATATGGDDAWDVTRYLNIWIGNISGGILGYGEFPTGTLSNTYGLVLNYTATGTMGTAAAPYNKGRTGTHEFGHCFNLTHIWGDNGQCGNTDNCTDTPPQKGGTNAPAGCNYGTPTYPWQANTCTRPDGVAGASVTNTNGDMFMNFMDYTDDAAMNMFSKQQCLRMVAVVSTAPWNVLQSSNACTPVSALDAGITTVIAPVNGASTCNNNVTPKITLTNTGSTTLTSAKILYKMDALATQTLNWSGSLASATSTILTLNAYAGLSNASHTFSATVTAPNAGTDANAANNTMTSTFSVIAVPAGSALPFVERFDAVTFPPTGWVKLAANTLNAANTWTRVANTTGIPVVPTTTACAKMDNFSGSIDITGQLDALRTPALSFTGANSSLNVTFDVSHKMYSTVDIDTLNVFISTDCGGTWTNLYTKGGTQLTTSAGAQTTAFTPTANAQWRRETVSLTAYAGLPSVYLKFESRSGWGNNVYLDNVNVSYTTAAVPVASFTSSATKCSGSAITFSDQSTNTPTGWNWSFPGGSPSTATVQNPSVTYTASGTYTVTLISANGSGTCTPVSQTITVNATPTVAVSNATICLGTSASITANGATTYSWNTGATTSSISVTPTVTSNYTVTGTSSGCVNTKTVSVTVNATPTVVVSSATVCSGTSANLSATGAATYSWNSGATTSSISVTPIVTTNYTVTGTTLGCASTKTVTVTVNALPTVAVSNVTICSGSTGTLVASGANTYTWNTGATGSNLLVSPTVNTNYTVMGTSAAGCVNTTTASVTVGSAPSIAVNSTSICSGSSAILTASGVSTFTWSTGLNTASISVNPTSTTVYTVSGNLAGCSASASNTATVTVVSNPTANAGSSQTITCMTPTVSLTGSGVSTYTWSGAGIVSGGNTSTPVVNSAGTYTLIGSTAGCSSSPVSVNVLSNTTPPAVTSTVSGSLDCINSFVNAMVSTPVSPVSYNWSGSGIVAGASTGTITVVQGGVFNYTVTNTSNGCNTIGSQAVTQNTTSPTVSVNSLTICSGSTGTLTASGSATTYSWNTGATGANLIVSPTSNANYTVTATGINGCVNTATASVNVSSAPSISINSSTICSGSTATLSATGVTTYTWNTSSNASSISVSPTGTTVYTVTGNLSGCSTQATQTATVMVNSLPNVTLGAISGPLCVNNAAVALSGSPAGGIYSGAGVSGSSFDPAVSGAGTFMVMYTYTDANTCSASASQTVNVNLCTGLVTLNGADAFSISVYPNPAKDAIYVLMDASFIDNTTIELYDAIGKLVIAEKVVNTNTSININSLSTGMYTLRVISDGKQISKRIIKE